MQAAASPEVDVPLIEVRHVKRYFGTKDKPVRAVDDVSFAIRRGETLGLVGESGSGKSTIGRTVLRLLECTAGQVLYRGEDIGALPAERLRKLRSKLQIIFQDPYASLNPKMRISAILGEALSTHGLAKGPGERERRIAELLQTGRPAARTRQPLPARVFRRAAPAHRRCARAGGRTGVHRRRRALVGPGRVDPGAGHQPAGRSARAPVADHALHLARSRRRRVPVRPCRRALSRPGDGGRADRRAVRAATAPVHPGPAGRQPQARPADPERCRAAEGRHPEPDGPPSGCVFRTRCPHAIDACAQTLPALDEVSPGRFSACLRKDLLITAAP